MRNRGIEKKHRNRGELLYTLPKYISGNGPSGISLSHLLSGNLPYYKGQNIGSNHSASTWLHEKCQESSEFSIVEQVSKFSQ